MKQCKRELVEIQNQNEELKLEKFRLQADIRSKKETFENSNG
jgi:hypothetical protein